MLLTATAVLFLFIAPLSATAEHVYYDSDGVEIAYRVDGDSGSPVLLIHGYTANGDLNWRLPGVVSDLARDHRVIVIDNRGHGKSEKPERAEAYGVEMVNDAVRLLDHLGIDSAHWVGYSMGGMITLKAMALYPSRVRSAVIGGMGWTRAGEETRKRYENGSSRRSSHPALEACYRRFWELGLTEAELRAITVPFSLVVGSEDGLLRSSVEPLREVRPEIPLVVIEGANHAGAVLKRDFREAVHRLVDRQSEGE